MRILFSSLYYCCGLDSDSDSESEEITDLEFEELKIH